MAPDASRSVIKYRIPEYWMRYDPGAIVQALAEAKAAVLALHEMPYQRDWVEHLQEMELKREVAGTSRIEGADFSDLELDQALTDSPEQLLTRSQRQARAAVQTYRWIAGIQNDVPLNDGIVFEIHRKIVTGADDDHCMPGALRSGDQNVLFGRPRHRGVEGGQQCRTAFARFIKALGSEFPKHDPLLSALAAHYHLAAMHPFLDGNGRTARAFEALMLQRAGFRDICFISMSNYYYDEKPAYLATLAKVRELNHDLTPFFLFGLRGVASQASRVLKEIQAEVSKAVYRNLMYDLFKRLRTPRKRVIAERQVEVMKALLDRPRMDFTEIVEHTERRYSNLHNPHKALVRDLRRLIGLGAIKHEKSEDGQHWFSVRLEWPKEISESDFLRRFMALPKAKSHPFLG